MCTDSQERNLPQLGPRSLAKSGMKCEQRTRRGRHLCGIDKKGHDSQKLGVGVRGLGPIIHSNKVQSNRPSESVVQTVGDLKVDFAWQTNIQRLQKAHTKIPEGRSETSTKNIFFRTVSIKQVTLYFVQNCLLGCTAV
jgi:hypothetical protein